LNDRPTRELGLVEQLARAGRLLQVMIGLVIGPKVIWNVIVVEADEPAVTVTLLGFAESVTAIRSAPTGLTRQIMNSKIKPTESSKTLSLLKNVTELHFPLTLLRLAV
jgi:hypothetical protein